MRPAHPENVRTALGNGAKMLCPYPLLHEQRYREGLTSEGRNGVLLCRSAWAGSQRHGVILWSGDVWSDWDWFRAQVPAGLHAGMAGMGWWTTDIGGFYDGHGGSDVLVAPVLHSGAGEMTVTLPDGETWLHAWSGGEHAGGSSVTVPCPWGQCPVFVRKAAVARFGEAFPVLRQSR